MKDAPIRFLLDGGRHMILKEMDPGTFELLTDFKSGSFNREVDVHVVPYGQNSVDDMLTEENLIPTKVQVSTDPQ